MVVVGLADIHGDTEHLAEISNDLYAADLVLVAGDLTHFGGRDDAARVLSVLRTYNPRILAVPGNCDLPQVASYLTDEQANLHGGCVTIDNVAFTGIGGSLPCPGRTPNELPEFQFQKLLDRCDCGLGPDMPVVFVTHQPPYGTAADIVAPGSHVGSTSVRDFINRIQPRLCLCGHIHEARCKDTLGKTIIINPGPQRRGFYAYIEMDTELRLAEIREATA